MALALGALVRGGGVTVRARRDGSTGTSNLFGRLALDLLTGDMGYTDPARSVPVVEGHMIRQGVWVSNQHDARKHGCLQHTYGNCGCAMVTWTSSETLPCPAGRQRLSGPRSA
jgi:hypothetical protein